MYSIDVQTSVSSEESAESLLHGAVPSACCLRFNEPYRRGSADRSPKMTANNL